MTTEEAIKHFESQARCSYAPTREAAQMAIAALRIQREPLDRSRWAAHPVEKRRPDRYERFEEAELSRGGEVLYRKIVTINENVTVAYCSACGKRLCSRFESFCPNCGRPLTEETWADLERRIGGNDGKTD